MSTIISHFIFDMDGLLLDTEPFYTEVTQKIVSFYGKDFTWALKSQMMGRPAIESAHLLVDTLDLPITPEEYLEKRDAGLLSLFPTSQFKPGAESLLKEAGRRRIPQGVATSSSRKNFLLKTKKHKEWMSNFEVIITGDDPEFTRGKPAPDIYLATAKRMGAVPTKCLVFEDSVSGMEAGLAAGMQVIAVPDPNLDKELYKEAGTILTSLEEFNFDDWNIVTA